MKAHLTYLGKAAIYERKANDAKTAHQRAFWRENANECRALASACLRSESK